MRAGKLRHFIDFEELSVTMDSDGAQVEEWIPVYERVPASIEPMSGRELIAASAVNAKSTTRIECRFLPNVDPAWRIRHREILFNIDSVMPDEWGNQQLKLLCHSGTNQG